ncbi:MAG: SDR family oxidoreductase [Bacteroidota bacterium]
MQKYNVLVTGGAGFIGANLTEKLLSLPQVAKVRVLDNLATGSEANIAHLLANPQLEFVKGDIRDFDTCKAACEGIDCISHQAALGSVPRSINDPITSNEVNITGTLHIFTTAKEAGIKRIVYAASSSTYGDSKSLPKVEDIIGKPLSPYAVTKYVNELYANVFAQLYSLEPIGLRYFNVFGPKQNPKGPYAAVIPLFMQAAIQGKAPTINGDGLQSRDFTYVANAVSANILALFTENSEAVSQVYNIACGQQTTLNALYEKICTLAQQDIPPHYGATRVGDVKHSLADISKAKRLLGYNAPVAINEGLQQTFDWYKEQHSISQ